MKEKISLILKAVEFILLCVIIFYMFMNSIFGDGSPDDKEGINNMFLVMGWGFTALAVIWSIDTVFFKTKYK